MTNMKPPKTLLVLNLLNDVSFDRSDASARENEWRAVHATYCFKVLLRGEKKNNKLPLFYYPNVTLKSGAESEIK